MVSGFEEVDEALDSLDVSRESCFVEPLFCSQGCINGPGTSAGGNLFARRADVLAYAGAAAGDQASEAQEQVSETKPPNLETSFSARPVNTREDIGEEQIRQVLALTGQAGVEDELNCGACGYGSCRDRAVAVVRGLAEPEMCIPYMRRLAEQRTDKIIETSPNGIVILDERLEILRMNPAFKQYFTCSEATCGKHVSYLMDPEPFERLLAGAEEKIELVAEHKRYNIICHQILYKLHPDNQFVGIFVNTTNNRETREKLERLRQSTITQAQELLDHQVTVAREMAAFLGESTARGESLVQKLIELAAERDVNNNNRREFNPWPTNTVK